MNALIGPYASAAVLLCAAGISKVVKPANTSNALQQMGIPAPPSAVRIGAGIEVMIAMAAWFIPGPVPRSLVAVSYLIFAGFVATAMRKGTPINSCGCFGEVDSPPTMTHIGINLFFAVAAIFAVFDANSRVLALEVFRQQWSGVPLLALVAICSYLAYLSLSELPRLRALSPKRSPRRSRAVSQL